MLDYWRDSTHRFYLSWEETLGYHLRTEDNTWKAPLGTNDLETLTQTLYAIEATESKK